MELNIPRADEVKKIIVDNDDGVLEEQIRKVEEVFKTFGSSPPDVFEIEMDKPVCQQLIDSLKEKGYNCLVQTSRAFNTDDTGFERIILYISADVPKLPESPTWESAPLSNDHDTGDDDNDNDNDNPKLDDTAKMAQALMNMFMKQIGPRVEKPPNKLLTKLARWAGRKAFA